MDNDEPIFGGQEQTPEQLFERWFAHPLRELGKISNGDGSFIALSISVSLFERFAKSEASAKGKKADDAVVHTRLAEEFEATVEDAKEFWRMVRNGLQHYAMPMKKQQGTTFPRWTFDDLYIRAFEFVNDSKGRKLNIQPWLFRDAVLRLYKEHPDLITHNQSFPVAKILPDDD